jgi:signal transduction histidine kinase
VKNSYDADATKVVIRIDPNHLEVIDNGHGMTLAEFESYWMRVGSPHKQGKRVSREFRRPMTGSKGVGRLAVQFLARKLELRTVSKEDADRELQAIVDWDEAVHATDLTKAVARCWENAPTTAFPDETAHGTGVTLTELNQSWGSEAISELAREVWWLQPPFRSNPLLISDQQRSFTIALESADEKALARFDAQMRAFLDIWNARLVGKLVTADGEGGKSRVRLTLEFADGKVIKHTYPVSKHDIHSAEFEIRLYHLKYRQPRGITVSEAREYLNRFGGVHMYDAGFHLPYYGPDTDWLHTEIDHSHRLSASELLPAELQVSEGMNFLPTLSRILGIVHVDTAKEREAAAAAAKEATGDFLQIQVTRDRLVDNRAFQTLRNMVRYALDFYAMEEAKRAYERTQAEREVEPVSRKFERVDEVLARHKGDIPKPLYEDIRSQVKKAIQASETEAEASIRQAGLLGALATAGIVSLAYQHEAGRQFQLLEEVVSRLKGLRISDGSASRLAEITDYLTEWIQRAKATRALFSHLLDEQSRESRQRYRARSLINGLIDRMGIFVRGATIETSDIEETLILPKATLAEWAAIFQNVILNALNAMIDSPVKKIFISSRVSGRRKAILVQDTGRGVDISSADELFEPFARKLRISAERRALGLGGMGLGLTIVRMIASNVGCKVRFVKPEKGYKTAFELSWSETR